jgi:hypothetical protein
MVGHYPTEPRPSEVSRPWLQARTLPDDRERCRSMGSLLILRAPQNVRINPALRWTSRPQQALLSTDR